MPLVIRWTFLIVRFSPPLVINRVGIVLQGSSLDWNRASFVNGKKFAEKKAVANRSMDERNLEIVVHTLRDTNLQAINGAL